jgi:hypothetical protein
MGSEAAVHEEGPVASGAVTGNLTNHADDLADKLLEKREKLQYFIVTASTASVVFSFNNASGLLRKSSVWLALAAWGALLLAAGLALFSIRERHKRYTIWVDTLYQGKSELSEEDRRKTNRSQRASGRAEPVILALFVTGITLLAISFGVGLWKG